VRTAGVDVEIARQTLEVAHWVMEREGTKVSMSSLEYVDLSGGVTHKWGTRRKGTISHGKQNAKIIQTLWPSI
jgi:hypothetical protein